MQGAVLVSLYAYECRFKPALHLASVGHVTSWFAVESMINHHQLIGLEVTTVSGQGMGRIEEIMEKPANDVWVSREGSVEHLIPATDDAITEVDLSGGRVVVADWLLNVEDAKDS